MKPGTLLAAMVIGGVSLLRAAEAPLPKAPDSPLADVNAQLPAWLRFSGELRARGEGFLSNRFVNGNDDLYLLQRVRLALDVRLSPWLRFYVQGQDSRVSFTDRVAAAPPLQDSADLRQAYVQFGSRESRWLDLTAGRQELAFGEERLVGGGNWGNVARSFDALKLGLHHRKTRVDIFASSVVTARDHRFDRHIAGDNLHGIYGQLGSWIPQSTIEPYLLWRLAPSVLSETKGPGRLDTKTLGLRWAGQVPGKSEYAFEAAAQTGSWGSDTMRAWAVFGRFGHEFSGLGFNPRLRLELNRASGDHRPDDGHHGTFDVLYPTPHDKYGLTDQVGWKNINHIGFIAEIKPRASLVLQSRAHDWWLASARDGLYNAGGTLLVRDTTGRSGSHVGKELDFQVIWSPNKHVGIAGGLGHLFPGEFLTRTTPGRGYTFPYVQLTYGL
ncbi:MAG: alginate export family protein [Bryobacteraceae bacterium]|nr:alginate export family protein [Bryobacteraceae bacterium]